MQIIHGEDTVSSYRKLTELIDSAKNSGVEIISRDVTELNPTSLRQELASTDLFGTGKIIVVKNLLTGTKSKQRDLLVKIILDNYDSGTILYETKKVSDTALKPFSKAQIQLFTISPVIFKFLDLLRPGNSRNILNGWNRLLELNNEPEYVFSMLVRQFRLLIQAKSGPSYLKLAPYPKKMILSQASHFELAQLLDLHSQLYQIDKKIKTGSSPVALVQLLVHFFLKI